MPQDMWREVTIGKCAKMERKKPTKSTTQTGQGLRRIAVFNWLDTTDKIVTKLSVLVISIKVGTSCNKTISSVTKPRSTNQTL